MHICTYLNSLTFHTITAFNSPTCAESADDISSPNVESPPPVSWYKEHSPSPVLWLKEQQKSPSISWSKEQESLVDLTTPSPQNVITLLTKLYAHIPNWNDTYCG